MIFTQAGDTKKSVENGMKPHAYKFAVLDKATNHYKLQSEKIGYWSIGKKYSTGFRLEVIL